MPNGQSRRRFLEASLAASAATVLSAARSARGAVVGANDRIRIGVIGTGGRARYLMRLLADLPGHEMVAVSDVYEPRMLEAAEIAGSSAARHADYRRVLDDASIDAVLIGSPDHWHKDMTLQALAAGKDVYLEKPVSHSIEEGAEMARAVAASDRVVQTGTQQRSWSHYQLGKELIDSGRLGRITFVHSYWYQRMNPWRAEDAAEIDASRLDWKSWLGTASDQPFDAERFRRWRHFKDFGGGVLTDLLTHWIDVVHWYLGAQAPAAATTRGANYRLKTLEWPDTVTTSLEYPEGFMVTHTGSYASSIDDGGLEFRGDEATLKVDRERLVVYSEASRSRPGTGHTPEPEILVRSQADGTISHLQNWLDCIRSRKTPAASMAVAHQAARASWIGNAALLAGKTVRWDAASGRVTPVT
jgi:predicted dehydrogenase